MLIDSHIVSINQETLCDQPSESNFNIWQLLNICVYQAKRFGILFRIIIDPHLNLQKSIVDMDISDFEGNFKYKLIIPALYLFNWILIFLGPSVMPLFYQWYSIIGWTFMIFKILYLNYNMIVILKRTYQTLNKAPELTYQGYQIVPPNSNLIHCFIIPSYKQDLELLGQTLQWIGSHSRAHSNYMIMLAMEKHEQNSDQKAAQLIRRYSHLFRIMDYTRHQIRQNEQKGKASNVSWCGQHLDQFFYKYKINQNDVLITIIDADSWVPPLYIDKIQEYILEVPEHKHKAIFVPPQIFTRNYLQVPVFTRVYDHTHSLAQLSNMRSCWNLIFPISNYTISYNMIEKIGFWDTCADAIGEDFHTTQKAFWKTKGDMLNVPIYVPFNQVNVQTGQDYWSDVAARFWQAQRHAQGCADVAYNINMLLKTKYCSFKSLLVIYSIWQCFAVPAIIPWTGLSLFYQSNLLYKFTKASPELYSIDTVNNFFHILTALTVIFWIMFQIFKRYTNKKVYKKQNQSLWRILQYPLVISLDLFFIAVPTFIIAAFGTLFKSRQYRVAQKKINK